MIRFVVLAFVLLSLVAPKGLAQSQSSQSKTGTENLSRQPATLNELPEDLLNTELRLLGGKTLKLSEYKGKVVLLNLFATWCGPCRLESPDLAKLQQEFKSNGLVVIELSTEDPAGSVELVREWVWEFRLSYPVGWVTRDFALTLLQGRQSIPQAFVIARDGRILKRFIGYHPEKTFDQMRTVVAEALQ